VFPHFARRCRATWGPLPLDGRIPGYDQQRPMGTAPRAQSARPHQPAPRIARGSRLEAGSRGAPDARRQFAVTYTVFDAALSWPPECTATT
jgi:hypothetical protein